MSNTPVYCERCPIVLVCWGETNSAVNRSADAKDCVLAKLYNGDLKVKVDTTFYVTKD